MVTTPSAPLPSQSTGPVDVTDQIERGVVLIEGETPNEVVAGTGMVLTADGEVMTNYHVVRSTQSLTVTVALFAKMQSEYAPLMVDFFTL